MITRKSFFKRWQLVRDNDDSQVEKSVIDIDVENGQSVEGYVPDIRPAAG